MEDFPELFAFGREVGQEIVAGTDNAEADVVIAWHRLVFFIRHFDHKIKQPVQRLLRVDVHALHSRRAIVIFVAIDFGREMGDNAKVSWAASENRFEQVWVVVS